MSGHTVAVGDRVYRLGRLNDTVRDPANRDYPAARSLAPWRPVRWKRRSPALEQRVGSCTGHSLAGWLNTSPATTGLPLRTDADAERYYGWGTRVDGIRGVWPPTDTGSTGPAVAKAARNHGQLASWGHAFGIEHLLDALQLGPVMVGTVWLDSMFEAGPTGIVKPSGQVAGGHEYLADEYVPAIDLVGFQNSWGADWGVDGRFYLRRTDVAALLADGGDVTVPRVGCGGTRNAL